MAPGCFAWKLGLRVAVCRRQGRDHGCCRLRVTHDGEKARLRGKNPVELMCSRCSWQSKGGKEAGDVVASVL